MLFYRRKSTHIQKESIREYYEKIPKWLMDEIQKENVELNLKRDEYEKSLNEIKVEFYLETDFYLEKNILNLNQQCENQKFLLSIDKRSTIVNDLKEILIKYCIEQNKTSKMNDSEIKECQQRKESCLNLLFDEKPIHFLLVNRVDTSNSGRFSYFVHSLLNEPSENVYKLINATKSKDCVLVLSKSPDLWPIGDDFEPVRIVFKFFNNNFEIREMSCTFIKSTPIKLVKEEILSTMLAENCINNELGIIKLLNILIIKIQRLKLKK